MKRALRPGKIFVDWSQNSRHKTTIAVYSLRARPTPTVSTPITWDEVAECAAGRPLSFEAGEVVDRVDELGDLMAPAAHDGPAAPDRAVSVSGSIVQGSVDQQRGIEPGGEVGGESSDAVASARPAERASSARTSAGVSPSASRSSRVTAPSRLARRAPSGPRTNGTWAWRWRVEPERRRHMDLAGGGVEQVVAADHLFDPGEGIVDDDHEVVGRHAVVAHDHEVVD